MGCSCYTTARRCPPPPARLSHPDSAEWPPGPGRMEQARCRCLHRVLTVLPPLPVTCGRLRPVNSAEIARKHCYY